MESKKEKNKNLKSGLVICQILVSMSSEKSKSSYKRQVLRKIQVQFEQNYFVYFLTKKTKGKKIIEQGYWLKMKSLLSSFGSSTTKLLKLFLKIFKDSEFLMSMGIFLQNLLPEI